MYLNLLPNLMPTFRTLILHLNRTVHTTNIMTTRQKQTIIFKFMTSLTNILIDHLAILIKIAGLVGLFVYSADIGYCCA